MKRLFTPKPSMGPAAWGFTLIEMLVVVAIGGILAAVAVPSLVSVIESNRRTIISNQLMEDLAYARRSALTLSRVITVCGVSGDPTDICIDTRPMDWSSNGWYTLISDGSAGWELRAPRALASGWKVDAYLGISDGVIFFPHSRAAGNGHFTIYRSGSTTAACVVVNPAGRARAYTATVATGVVSNATGQDPCAS